MCYDKFKGGYVVKKSRILYDEQGNPVEIITSENISFKEKIKNYFKECALRALHVLLVFAIVAVIFLVLFIWLKSQY